MKIIAFFNNKGGVGKTSLVYHLAWIYAEQGLRVVAADLDPQSNLTAMFLDEERLEVLWPDGDHADTILGIVQPILDGVGDIADPHLEAVGDNLWLVVGDMGLARFEDRLSEAWPKCLDADAAAFRVTTAFYRALSRASAVAEANVVLIDVGPNLGAINRAALVASSHVVVPLAPDLFSLQGLRNLGPTLRQWRRGWQERKAKTGEAGLEGRIPIPSGAMEPVGYVIMQHAVRLDRPVKAYERWALRIPSVYHESVLGETGGGTIGGWERDSHCLALLKHYRSLMPLAMEAHKPMFYLKPADGAAGAHMRQVERCYDDFRSLAQMIAERCGIPVEEAG